MQDRKQTRCQPRRVVMVATAVAALALAVLPRDARSGEVVFLKDGRTIEAEKTEVIGDRVRIQRPTEVIELPRASVLSIHEAAPPGTRTTSPPAAKVYPGVTQEMNERVRQEIQQGRTPSRP
jgi:hypothetical protein